MKKRFLLLFMLACSCIMWGQTIMIETLDDLVQLSSDNATANGYAGQTIELNANLTITKPWRPIGTAAQPFQGTFKGNGHVISGLGAISGTDGVGLFGYVGANGTVQEVGIGTGHIKTMKNDVCENIGALAGCNAGTIVRCWNMATVEANGNNVGGLVGQNNGKIEDCYNAGPILKATDVIGGLVGMNTGKINRCYNIGFARNGYGLVEKSTGTITEGYYDSQLYIQIPEPYQHIEPEGVTAVEKTETMFSLFASSEQWTNSNDNYPMLTVFKEHDAAKVSVASANVDPLNVSTENHMNILIGFFTVNTGNGVSWNTTSEEQANWVFPTGINNEWGIAHPCRPTECILTVSKGNHVREVYAAPLPVNPFDPGVILADTQTICVDDTLYFQHVEYVTYGDPGGGVADYKILLIATQFNFDGDSIKNDTILDAGFGEYYDLFWHGGHWIPTEPGIYKIRRYAADSQCHLDYAEAYGCIPVIAPDTVNPGDINASESDSLCYADSVITISNKEAAQCPKTKILYYWTVNGDSIEGAHAADLEYTLPQPGTYSFLRYAYNDKCTSKEEAKVAPTEYNVILLDEFKEGEIISTDTFRICNPEDVITTVGTITATEATGGDNKIGYQWYMLADGTPTAISGATSQDLILSDVANQLSFEFDKTYSIFRMVNDSTCQTEPISSKDTVIIIVYPKFEEGDIQAADDTLCWEAEHTITINSAADATFGSLDVFYYWTVQFAEGSEDSIQEANAASLTYTDFIAPGTYTFHRYAYNILCVDRAEAIKDSSEYKVTLLEEFKEGEISSTTEFFVCDTAMVISTVGTITATEATGGDNKIGYQWYMLANETPTAIEGATSQNLTLSDVADQLSFEFDKTYSFFRMVNDSTCQTESISSKDTVVITVYPEFKEGDIQAADDSLCWEAERKVTINSTADATFGSLDVFYYWTVQFANGSEYTIQGAEDASLTDFTDFIAPGTYTFRRYAYNTICMDINSAVKDSSEYKVTFLEEFEPSSIIADSIAVCTVEEALALITTIQGNPATGGDGTYSYKWNMREEGTTDMLPDSIANGKDLDLTKVTLRQGFKYTFYREAKDDYCQTEWQRSDNTVIIDIYGAVTAGEIENKTIDSTCMVASLTEKFDVVIGSVKDATTPKGDIAYTWYMIVNNGDPVIVGNDKTFTYTFETKDIDALTTYTFYRTAKNIQCGSEEVRAEGVTKVQVSLTGTIEKELILCESQFINGKYDYYYPVENPYRKVTFDLNNPKSISFSDLMASTTCPPYVTLTPVVIPSPAISTDNEAEVCQDGETGALTLYFLMEKGSADMYSIELSEGLRPYFNNQAYISGDLNETVHEGERGAITLQCNRIGLLGEKIMYLQVGTKSEQSGQETCFSTMKAINLHIAQGGYIMSKYDKVLFIDNNPKKETDHKFIDYQWYKNGAPVEGAKGQYYTEGGEILHGSYFADLTYLENGLPVVLRTCTMEMPIENSRKTPLPTENVSKQLENGRIVIQRGEAKFDVLGNKISSL